MRNGIKAMIAAGAIGAASMAAVQPAEARYYHGGGNAVAAGIIGLGVGAAIASADRPHYGYYGYGYAPPPPPPPVYYGGYGGYYGYGAPVVYAPGYYHGYYGRPWGYHYGWRR